ncbi:MAG: right-handed parallel beta-helix repeat-containing protein [Acidobacteria bacterium]|nr:right-handed parallel beta-helix repeat-containing protein [Acidobacteriota bacterium]
MKRLISMVIAVTIPAAVAGDRQIGMGKSVQPRILTVSKTPGLATFNAIEPALEEAAAQDTIEIIDDGVYEEDLLIREAQTGLTLRARTGNKPVVKGAGPSIIEIFGAEGVTIEGLRITGGAAVGLVATGPAVRALRVNDCRFETIPSAGILLDNGDAAEIVDCTFRNLGGAGISLRAGADVEITSNDFYGGPMNTSLSNGILVEGSSVLIDRNYLIGLGGSGIATVLQPVEAPRRESAVTIVNNLITGCGAADPQEGDGIRILGSSNTVNHVRIVNNTIVNSARLGVGFGFEAGAIASRAEMYNTIVTASGPPGGVASDIAVYSEASVSLSQTTAQTTIRFCFIGQDPVFGSLTRDGNITGDPKFEDAARGNYRLGYKSPCIDAGSNEAIADFTYDAENSGRIFDGDSDGHYDVDIGAYEYDYTLM